LTVEEDDVRDGEDGIVLSEREREALVGLAQSIGDPWLAGQLTGNEQPARPQVGRTRRWPSVVSALAGWIGVLLVVTGAVLAATTFMHSTVMASLGLAVMGAGLWRLTADRGEAIVRRVRAGGQWRPRNAGGTHR
jgi:hypothetical protein